MRSARRDTIRLAAVGLCVALALAPVGCRGRAAPQPAGGATGSKADKARREAEALALGVAQQAADAHAQAERRHPVGAAVKTEAGAPDSGRGAATRWPTTTTTAPRPEAVIREHVASALPAPEPDADEDALAAARDVVERKLAELDPPVRHKPSLAEVKASFLRKGSRQVRRPTAAERAEFAPYVDPDKLVYVEYEVEVTDRQVRDLRVQDRVAVGLRAVGLVAVVALAGFLFLRADEWTKGYLTRWLALVAVTLVGAAAAALVFV
jgi:hypothetical protein